MPIVTIQSHQHPGPERVAEMLAEVRRAGAKALPCAPENIWVVFLPVPPAYYLVGPENSPPAIVQIQANAGRSREERERFLFATAESIARGLGLPAEAIWMHYQELNPSDIWVQRGAEQTRGTNASR